MPVSATTLRLLMEAGIEGDELVSIVASIDNDMEPKGAVRSSAAERQKRYRERNALRNKPSQTITNRNEVTLCDGGDEIQKEVSPKEYISNPLQEKSSPKEKNTKKEKPRSGPVWEFERWYAEYPHKVGKAAAQRAFLAALRKSPLTDLESALERYIRTKPPDRPWCNPATWLNQERWKDEPAELTDETKPRKRTQAELHKAMHG